MLRLHYVPGSHGSPVCPKRSAPWDFGYFPLYIQVLTSSFAVFYGLLRNPWWAVGRSCRGVPEAPRRTTVLPRMPARSPQASYVLIGPLSFLAFLWSSYTFLTFCQVFLRMKHGRRETMDHVCTREGLLVRNNHCIMTLRNKTSWIPKTKILFSRVCWVHT